MVRSFAREKLWKTCKFWFQNDPAAGIDADLLQGQFNELKEEVELLKSQLDEETKHEYDVSQNKKNYIYKGFIFAKHETPPVYKKDKSIHRNKKGL